MKNYNYYKVICENLDEGIYIVDKNRTITYWNKGAEKISGFTYADVINKHCYDNILLHTNDAGDKLCILGCPLQKSIQTKEIIEATVYLQHKTGYRIPVSIRTIPIVENHEIYGAIEIFHVHHERFSVLYDFEELHKLALTDQLTTLPNRRYAENFLEIKISEFRALGRIFGVIFLDIDHFKTFNDQYGHKAGDEVLRLLAQTFISNLRSSDLIGRWGGEEFVGVCVCRSEDELLQTANKIRLLAEKTSIQYQNQPLNVTVSIGATIYKTEDTAESIIQRADELMYQSKSNGRNRITIG